MPKKSSNKSNKLKNSLSHVVRSVFEKNNSSELSHKQVCTLIDVRENALRKLVFDILENLVQQGVIIKRGHGIYKASNSDTGLIGVIELTNRGAGFVVSDDSETDIYIAPQNTGHALHGDTVKVRVFKHGKTRKEGEVITVIQRERSQFVGTIELQDKFGFLIPDNLKTGTDIYIPKEKFDGKLKKEKLGETWSLELSKNIDILANLDKKDIFSIKVWGSIFVALILLLGLIVFFTKKSFKKIGYAFRSHDAIYKSGLISETTTIIPFNRVQHVALHQGFISRKLGLASVELFTAGGSSSDLKIPGLLLEEAQKIKNLVSQKINPTAERIESEPTAPLNTDYNE